MEHTWSDALDVELGHNDAGAPNVRCYLATLLQAVLEEEESFSGKRPFGNSGWLYEIEEPLREAGFNPDEEGFYEGLVNELCGTQNDAAEPEDEPEEE